jgi:hypothetical protein
LEPSGEFSAASLYKALHKGAGVFRFKELWKTKVPLKIKISIWQMARGRIPSGDQVQKRRGPGDGLCPLSIIEKTRITFSLIASSLDFSGQPLAKSWVLLGSQVPSISFSALAREESGQSKRIQLSHGLCGLFVLKL